jgi:hypothetical protein
VAENLAKAYSRAQRPGGDETMRSFITLLTIAFALCSLARGARQVNLWIIPIENAGPGEIAAGEDIGRRVDAFNREFANSRVTVENTTDPVLKMQLLAWNPAFAVPNAAVVTSQTGTLKALAAYAAQAGVDIRVRFITWDEAFGLISGLDPGARTKDYPDVVQIGSTWRTYLGDRRLIMSRPNWARDRGNWVDLAGLPASSLPYITDVRLLFYWKRLPPALPASREFVLNTSTWTALVDSISARAGSSDTITFPTGLTLNVLHDYAPLVWAGGGEFFVHGWFGWRADLTSPAALAVPLELQRRAIDTSRPHEPKTLITFPESSHEEVDRIFVNGGYRVTQEPANFIDRWRQDFQRRHEKDGLRFWDYAAAAVPPKSFLGGSDLVVTRGTSDPVAAFALADFLASNPDFTQILAESGFLPSGRRGYGTDILTNSLYQSTGSLPDVEHFVDAVQKAVQQGVEYPPLSEWPTKIENQRVQEAFQIIWRRMGERDPERLKTAAREAEWLINSRIYWVDELWNGVIEARWALIGTLFVAWSVAGYFIYRRLQAERALMLLVFLYRAYRHDAAKFLGDNFFGLASAAKHDSLPCPDFVDNVMALSIHFKDKLTPHIERISEGQLTDFFGRSPSMRLDEISDLAFCGATYIFEAKELKEIPYIQYGTEGLDRWRIERMPFSLVVALEEWFLNSVKHVAAHSLQLPILTVRFDGKDLIIESTGKFEEQALEVLSRRPGMVDLHEGRQGLKLIRNILYYAYRARVKIVNATSESGQPRIRLTILLKGYLKPV